MDITRPWNISSHSVCLAWIMQVVSAYPCSSSVPAQSRACVSITVSPSRSLYCADGRFAIGNIHNYQHAASYPAFIASGAPCAVCRPYLLFCVLSLPRPQDYMAHRPPLCPQFQAGQAHGAPLIHAAAATASDVPRPYDATCRCSRCLWRYAGLVDLLGIRWRLPDGTEKVSSSIF